ncbi:hypothetical protein T4A_11363 [Trichinella pseudospiralis]|uniref:Uncharacterized protein n=1 Tax=Trichinella pseudospiralis TaxID=6337 RepID=A0A0V1BYM2_TRIPS|nr:hypothetical protein T4A_11363 [Trichinella pseudospiralis]KRY95149.1 hypothetical protein T4C_6469 [Trichinella pseudospiralis]
MAIQVQALYYLATAEMQIIVNIYFYFPQFF